MRKGPLRPQTEHSRKELVEVGLWAQVGSPLLQLRLERLLTETLLLLLPPPAGLILRVPLKLAETLLTLFQRPAKGPAAFDPVDVLVQLRILAPRLFQQVGSEVRPSAVANVLNRVLTAGSGREAVGGVLCDPCEGLGLTLQEVGEKLNLASGSSGEGGREGGGGEGAGGFDGGHGRWSRFSEGFIAPATE